MNNINRKFNAVGFTNKSGTDKVTFVTHPVRKIKDSYKLNYNLRIVNLPEAMDRVSALKYALTQPEFSNESDQLMLSDNLEYQQQNVEAATAPKRARGRPRKEVVLKPSLDVIRARVQSNVNKTTVSDVLNAINLPTVIQGA